jgi:hypothetical protein
MAEEQPDSESLQLEIEILNSLNESLRAKILDTMTEINNERELSIRLRQMSATVQEEFESDLASLDYITTQLNAMINERTKGLRTVMSSSDSSNIDFTSSLMHSMNIGEHNDYGAAGSGFTFRHMHVNPMEVQVPELDDILSRLPRQVERMTTIGRLLVSTIEDVIKGTTIRLGINTTQQLQYNIYMLHQLTGGIYTTIQQRIIKLEHIMTQARLAQDESDAMDVESFPRHAAAGGMYARAAGGIQERARVSNHDDLDFDNDSNSVGSYDSMHDHGAAEALAIADAYDAREAQAVADAYDALHPEPAVEDPAAISRSQEEIEHRNTCPICLDVIVPGVSKYTNAYGAETPNELYVLPCQHKLCMGCIVKFMHNQDNTCPVCRAPTLNIHDAVPMANYRGIIMDGEQMPKYSLLRMQSLLLNF